MCKTSDELRLIESTTNSISWCVDCEKFELLIKGVRLAYDRQELIDFCQSLAALQMTHFNYYLHREPEILLQDQSSKSKFFLTYSESKALQEQINKCIYH